MKRIATLAAIAATALTAGLASTADAATRHGPYSTRADCVHWAGVYEFHGYIVTRGCYQATNGSWYFVTS